MNVMSVSDNDQSAWDAFVQTMVGCTAYHQYRWRTVIENSFGHQGHYLAAVSDDGQWEGVLPLIHMKSSMFGNFIVSVPFVNYGGVLSRSPDATIMLLEATDRLRRVCGSAHVELRHLETKVEDLPAQQHKVTMILNLDLSIEEQWSHFNAKLRNQIRKAEKSGLEPSIGRLELLDGFYDVFARNMRDLGTPVYSKGFFRNIMTEFPETTRIIVVRLNEKIIAAGIALWFRDTIEVPWASSIAEYKSMCPNNMLYWEAIKFAIGRGFLKFDFGRSTPHEGTYNFKKQWGAEPVQLYWQYLLNKGGQLPALNTKNPKFEMAIKSWQRLPVWFTRIIGPHVVKNIP